MSIKNYLINSPAEINKLKSDLMSKKSCSSINMKALSSAFNQIQNTRIGKLFENNIRKTLTNIYGWKEINHPREFYYRIIEYEGKNDIFIENYTKVLNIENIEVIIEDNIVTIKYPNGKQEEINLKNREKNKFVIGKKNLIIGFMQKIEVDGIFLANSADISKFKKEEIQIIYNNVDYNQLEKYKYIIIEIKLSQNRVDELTAQLIRDKFVFELITKKENLFLGFTQAEDIEFEHEDKMKNINFILLGVKNSYFGERKVDEFIDWKAIENNNRKMDNFKKEINNRFETFENKILNELKNIKNMIAEQRERKKSSSSSDSKYQNNEEVNDKIMDKKKERSKSEKISSIPSKPRFMSLKRHRIPYLKYLLQQNIKMKKSKKD